MSDTQVNTVCDRLAGNIIRLQLGGGRGKPEYATFRNPRDIAEMIAVCDSNSHIWALTNDGKARRVKVNGKVRTWKRDSNRIEIPIEYGLYEYATFTASDIHRVLISVEVQ